MAKAKMLIQGLRNNESWMKEHNISANKLNEMEKDIVEGEKLNASVDELREKIHTLTADANKHLVAVKSKMQTLKREVKQHVDIERWSDFGVPDKR